VKPGINQLPPAAIFFETNRMHAARSLRLLAPRLLHRGMQLHKGTWIKPVRMFRSSPTFRMQFGGDQEEIMEDFLKPEPDPEDDIDFDVETYKIRILDEPIPLTERKPDSFFTHDVPNIERLREGEEFITLGRGLLHRGSLQEAVDAFEKGISLLEQYVYYRYEDTTRQKLHDKLKEHLFQPYVDLSICYQKVERKKKAKVLLVKVVYLLRHDVSHGEDLAHAAQNLAEVYSFLGRSDKAAEIAELHLPLAEHVMEKVHYAAALSNLSIYLSDQEKYEEAFQYGMESIDHFENELGTSHPLTLRYVRIFLRIVAFRKEEELYDELYEHFHSLIPDLDTYAAMRQKIENPSAEIDSQMKQKAEFDLQAEQMLPQIERATREMEKAGLGRFSAAVASEDLGSPFHQKD